MKYSIDKVHPTRDLTSHEKVFLQGLSEYKLFLDKSLFFQIDDLQKHTELVLSGETTTITACRSEFPDPDELKKEIEDLEKLIKYLVDKLEKDELPQEYWALLEEYRKRLKKLKEAYEEMTEYPDKKKKVPFSIKISKISLLGKYEHKKGDDSRVTLYVNNIEASAKNPYDIMLLMGQVLLHEYFHSFYYHVGVGSEERIKCVEEPMAEFGSLVVLDSVASLGLPISIYAGHALKYGLDFVKKKQSCKGLSAAYGFGAYIYEKHKDDYYNLISRYANVSRLLDDRIIKAKEYKFLVYPEYPSPSFEGIAFDKLKALLYTGGTSSIKAMTPKSISSIGSVTPSMPSHKPRRKTSSFTSKQIANCIKAYLFDGMSFRGIEQSCLGMPKRTNGGGFEAKKILNGLGIINSMKKQFYGKTIAEAISSAAEPLKSTLKWMEKNL